MPDRVYRTDSLGTWLTDTTFTVTNTPDVFNTFNTPPTRRARPPGRLLCDNCLDTETGSYGECTSDCGIIAPDDGEYHDDQHTGLCAPSEGEQHVAYGCVRCGERYGHLTAVTPSRTLRERWPGGGVCDHPGWTGNGTCLFCGGGENEWYNERYHASGNSGCRHQPGPRCGICGTVYELGYHARQMDRVRRRDSYRDSDEPVRLRDREDDDPQQPHRSTATARRQCAEQGCSRCQEYIADASERNERRLNMPTLTSRRGRNRRPPLPAQIAELLTCRGELTSVQAREMTGDPHAECTLRRLVERGQATVDTSGGKPFIYRRVKTPGGKKPPRPMLP